MILGGPVGWAMPTGSAEVIQWATSVIRLAGPTLQNPTAEWVFSRNRNPCNVVQQVIRWAMPTLRISTAYWLFSRNREPVQRYATP